MSLAALRLLELAKSQLGGSDARFEIGGEPPQDPKLVWLELGHAQRVVVVFEEIPADPDALRVRLDLLMASFEDTRVALDSHQAMRREPPADRRLGEQLDALRARAAAELVMVVDEQCPLVWSSSGLSVDVDQPNLRSLTEAEAEAKAAGLALQPLMQLDKLELDAAIASAFDQAGLASRARQRALSGQVQRLQESIDPEHYARAACAAALVAQLDSLKAKAPASHPPGVHHHEDRFRADLESQVLIGRRVTGIYWLLICFAHGWSELHAEAALRDMGPAIERLVLALPPFDPPPRGARVLRLPSPLRSV